MPWRNDATPRNTMKVNSTKSANLDGKAGVLHGAHMGGHSDVANMQTKMTVPGIKKFNPDQKLSNNPQGLKKTNMDKPKK